MVEVLVGCGALCFLGADATGLKLGLVMRASLTSRALELLGLSTFDRGRFGEIIPSAVFTGSEQLSMAAALLHLVASSPLCFVRSEADRNSKSGSLLRAGECPGEVCIGACRSSGKV